MIPGLHYFAGFALAFALAKAFGQAPAPASAGDPVSGGADLFSPGAVHQLRIELEPVALESLRKDPREFVSAVLSEPSAVYPRVAVHLKGSVGSFQPIDGKPSLTLDFARFEEGRKFHGLRRIHLNNSVEDPALANEQLGSELFQAAGVPAPRVSHARVVLNGRPLGLYVLKEGFTEDFLGQHFQKVGADLFEPEDGHDIDQRLKRNSVRGLTQGRAALQKLAAAATESDPATRWQRLEQVLDTDRFITFMALEVMLGHRDGYCLARNNFRVYHDLETGRMVFFPQGMDQLFGKADLPWQPSMAGLVAKAVMDCPEGKQRYLARFHSLYTNLFKVEVLTDRVDQLASELRPQLSASEWSAVNAEINRVKDRIVQRHRDLDRQLSRPPVRLMAFASGKGRPEGWMIAELPNGGTMNQGREPGGEPALHIVATSEAVASWRAKSLLPPGRYRFEGRARLVGFKPLAAGTKSGAALRVAGNSGSVERLASDSTWRVLATEFEVRRLEEEVEFICEFRARAGEAWFALDSLAVLPLKTYEK